MSLSVLRPGLLTTVQDLGRPGYRSSGVLVSGAMDGLALRVANLLVGNAETAAGLEFTVPAPHLRFEAAALLTLTGADCQPQLDGLPVPLNRVVAVAPGCELMFGPARHGRWGYLAVAGGVAVPPVLGSRATYLRAELGGWQGRRLLADDVLPLGPMTAPAQRLHAQLWARRIAGRRWAAAQWQPTPALLYAGAAAPVTVRALPGPEFDEFDAASRAVCWQQPFVVSPQSDRMGARLLGPTLARTAPHELLSSAVAFGTVQVPPGGQPIVLLADHQTTGGYPRMLQVISADFSRLVQAEPGQALRFAPVALAEAQAAYQQQHLHLQQFRRALGLVYL